MLAVAVTLAIASGCGKYGPPLPPEKLAPKAVAQLHVAGSLQGVSFSWSAPERDQRGKPLKEIEGYRVYRKLIERDSDIEDPRIEFEQVAMIDDVHLQKLDELRKAARAEGRIGRRVQIDAAEKAFQFTDIAVQPGRTYLYQIVPVNQGGVEGEADQWIKVVFRGSTSDIAFIPYSVLSDDLSF